MIVWFILSLMLWFLLVDVCRRKSFQPLNVGSGEAFGNLIIVVVISSVVGLILTTIIPINEFNTESLYLWPISVFATYMLHAVINKKYRNSIEEYFKFDRWNAIALVACIQYGFIITTT